MKSLLSRVALSMGMLGMLLLTEVVALAAEPAPPTISWTGAGGDALWSNTNNWTPRRAPAASDHVAITGNSNGFTVVLNVSASVGSLALGLDSGSITQRLQINNGAGLAFGTGSVVRALGELILPNGDGLSLSGAGLLEVRGLLDWTGGRLYGRVTIAEGGRALLRGGQYMRLTSGNDAAPAVFTNAGTVTWLGGERLYAYNNSQIINLGRWELAADGLAHGYCCGGAGATFLNQGTLVKTGGEGVTTMESFGLLNEGSVAAEAGVLRFTGFGSEWREGGQIGAGAGRVRLENGSATLAGTTTLNGTFEWVGDALAVNGSGVFTGPVGLEWTGGRLYGALTLATNSFINLRGGQYMRLTSGNDQVPAALTNHGTVIWHGGDRLYAYNNSQIVNFGRWELAADGHAHGHCCSGAGATFLNRGTLAKTTGAGSTTMDGFGLLNEGTVAAETGTLQINAGTEWRDGGRINGAGRVVLGGGPATLAGTTTLNATWEWAGVSVYGAGSINGSVPLVWRTGRLYGALTITPGSRLNFSGENYPELGSDDDATPAVITNRGTISWPGGTPLYARRSAQIYNYGQWRLEADGLALQHTCCGGWPTFHNFGTLAKTGGTNDTSFGNSVTQQRGTVQVAAGTLRFDQSTAWYDGNQITGSGRVLLNSGNAALEGTTVLNGSWQWGGVAVRGTGVISGPIPLVWRTARLYGTLTVSPGARMNLSGENYPELGSDDDGNPAVITNRGTVAWPGGAPLYARRSAQIYNHGQWRLEADGLALQHTCCGGWPTFHNFATLAKTGGINDSAFGNSVTLQRGTMQVAAGTLRFDTSTSWYDGNQITGSGRVLLNSGNATLEGTTILNGSWQWGSVAVRGTGVVSGPIPLVWRTARLYGTLTIAPGARMNFSGENYPELGSDDDNIPAVITNRGTVVWAGGAPLYGRRSSQIYNHGQWRLEGPGLALQHICCGGWPSLHNVGTLLKSGLGETTFGNLSFYNPGLLTVEAGQMTLSYPPANSGEFHFPVRGRVAGTDYGVLRVNGAYAHSGTLLPEFTNGFAPARGDYFDLITGHNLSGNIPTIALPTLPPDEGWTVDYSPSLARLRVTDACLADGLMAWWAGDGNADDQTGSYPGSLEAGATFAPGLIGQAFSLGSVDSRLYLGNWSPGTRWSLQAWVKLSSLLAGRNAILGGLNESRDWALAATDGYLGVWYRPPGGGTTQLRNVAPAQTNVWYHLAATYDGLSVTLYLNGALVGTAPAEANYVATSGPRIGGATYNPNVENFQGLVDEATIHNRPLTGLEIASTFNNGAAGRCAQLGLGVIAFAPQGLVTSDVTNFNVRFNQAFNTNTFTAADFAVTGPGGAYATAGFVVAPVTPFEGRSFNIAVPRLTNEGTYTVTVGPGIETLGSQPMPAAYTATFHLDKAAPQVIAFTPASPLSNQVNFIEATFSEAMSGATAQAADATITGPNAPAVTSVSQTASNRFRFQLNRPLGEGSFTIAIGPGLSDLAGNPMSAAFTTNIVSFTPDLAVVAVVSPVGAQIGATVPLIFTVTNQGGAPVSGPWRNTFFLATDATGTNAQSLGAATRGGVLPPGASLTLTQNVILPGGLAGARFLGVQVNSDNALVEITTTNNTLFAATVLAISAADLLPFVATVTPASVVLGSNITVAFTITNAGSTATIAAWNDRVQLVRSTNSLDGAILLGAPASSPLAVGGSYAREVTATVPLTAALTEGSYFILITADAGGAQAEANRANNSIALPLSITLPPLPDLAVADLTVPNVISPGYTAEFTWSVTNAGTLATGTNGWRERLVISNALAGAIPLGEFLTTNALAAGAGLSRTQAVALPNTLPAGVYFVFVTTDSRGDILEVDEANNTAVAQELSTIQAGLSLAFSPNEVTEGGASASGVLTRNGDLSSPLEVTITNNLPGRLTFTNVVVIPVGAQSAHFSVNVPADAVVQGDVFALFGAEAAGYTGAAAALAVRDATRPALTLTLTTNRVVEGFAVIVTVSRATPGVGDLFVVVAGSDSSRLLVPDNVKIPSGELNYSFSVVALENSFIQPSVTNFVTVSAAGFLNATAPLVILDNDLPAVTLRLSSTNLSEGAGAQAALATLTRSTTDPRALVLVLTSSDTNSLLVPALVTIPGGESFVSFPVTTVDNALVDGPRAVALRVFIRESGTTRIIAEGSGETVTVLDDDGPTLKLALNTDVAREGLAVGAIATVTRNTGFGSALVVALTSSDTTEATLPATVTIPANAASANFNVATVNDGTTDGSQRVTLSASAATFAAGSADLVVSDSNLPDLNVTAVTIPTSADTETFFNISYRVENRGAAPSPTGLVTRVFLSTDAVVGGDTLVGQYEFNGAIPPGQFFEQALTARLPRNAGRYWVIATTDATGLAEEIREDNNTRISAAPVQALSAYTATVQTATTLALAGTPVTFTGSAVRRGTAQPAQFSLVNLHLSVRGVRRIISALTDASGNFSTVFTPLPGEAGNYSVGAVHPGETEAPVQDTFTLLGFRAEPGEVSARMLAGETVVVGIDLANLSDAPLSGLAATLISPPPGLGITLAPLTAALEAFGTNRLTFTIAASNGTPAVSGSFGVRVTSTEGATVEVPVSFTVATLVPRLVATPGTLYAGMVRGRQTVVPLEIVNTGGAASGPLAVSLPSVPWLSLGGTNPLPSLLPGATNRLTLILTPAADLPLGPYDGSLAIDGTGVSLAVPFTIRAVSEAKGDLLVKVEDEYTYYAEGFPRVTNATVILRDVVTREVVTNGVTGADGTVLFRDLFEGYYEVETSADRHTTARDTTLLLAGRVNEFEPFISRQTVEYVWSVVPTEVQDRVHIVVETIFETVVPLPVVTIEPSVIDLNEMQGDFMQIDLRIANHGLIAAQDFELEFDGHPNFTFTPLVNRLGTLPAESSFTIPLVIRRVTSGGSGFAPASGAANAPCGGSGRGKHKLRCGRHLNGYVTPITIRNAGNCGGGSSGSQANVIGHVNTYGYGGGGTSSGRGGSGSYVAGRTFKQKEVCNCNDPDTDFQPDCAEIGLGLIGSAAKAAAGTVAGALNGSAALEVVGNMKRCTCCTETGEIGVEWEGSATVSGKLSIAIPVAGKIIKKTVTTPTYTAELEFGLGCEIAPAISLEGALQGKLPCNSWDVQICGSVKAGAPIEFYCKAGGSAEVTPVTGGPAERVALEGKIGIKTGVNAEWAGCVGGENTLKASIDPIVAFGTVEFVVGGIKLSETISQQLAPGSCLAGCSSGFGPASIGDAVVQDLRDQLLRAVQEAVSQFHMRIAPPAPATSFTPAGAPPGGDGICARVKLRLDQDLILTRNAFDATLELKNNDPANALEELRVLIEVRDANGQPADDLFGFRPPQLLGLTGVDGTGGVGANASGSAKFILVPSPDAAPDGPREYFVSGLFSYRIGGQRVTIPLQPVPITVRPSPRLFVNYFHQRDVFSDDPFTPAKEPPVPFSLGVMVENRGLGEARNVRIVSSQPQIVENEKGLLIDFKIIATEVAGSYLTPSLTADFGLIAPHTNAIGRWLLTSTLQGLFLDYKATFEHVDSLGKTNLSLVESVTIHEMNHLVQAGGVFEDGRPDFLVNEIEDASDLPDTLYLSDASTNAVAAVLAASADGAPTSSDLSVQLTAAMPSGWTYLRADDPANGAFRLARVVRSDGMEIALGTNVWTTDRTFIGGGRRPLYEHKLHLLDYDSTGSYTLYYEPIPAADIAPPFSAVAALPSSSYGRFPVSWSGDDQGGSGVANFDIFVSDNSGPFTPWLLATTLGGSVYQGELNHTYAFYSVASDNAGNREPAPLAADATTTVARTNSPPILAAFAPVTVNEGETAHAQGVATDADMPGQFLSWNLGNDTPPGVQIQPATGAITWPTGEANGPGTNTFKVIVRDSGSPSLSATGLLTIIVREVNSAPVLAGIANRTINEGFQLSITNVAVDGDLPAQTLTYSLGGGAPAGATMQAQTGVFRWRPSATQGGTTNMIAVLVADNGSPSLTATQQFSIIVRDTQGDFRLALGRTNVFRGQTSAVPVRLSSGIELTNIRFALELPVTALTNLSLQPLAAELASATLSPQSSNRSQIVFTPNAGESFQGDAALASLRFTALPSGPSLILPLLMKDLEARRFDGGLITNPTAEHGRVIIVGEEPVLEALRSPLGTHQLTLYGRPGRAYEIESTAVVPGGSGWNTVARFPMMAPIHDIPLSATNAHTFYRAVEYSPIAPRLQAGGAGEPFLLYGRAGLTYTVEATTNLTPPAVWRNTLTVPMTNSFRWLPSLARTNRLEFYRATKP